MKFAGWLAAAVASGVALVLAVFPIRVETKLAHPAPYTFPAEPDAGDVLQALSPVRVRRSDGVCFDYSDEKTFALRACFLDVSPPHALGRPLMPEG
jgi:hypothetical protein